MLRYTVLRVLVFLGCLSLLWLLGLRDRSEQPWLVVGAALLSMVVSAVVLRPMRAQYIAELSARVERRREARTQGPPAGSDESVEDAWSGEGEGASGDGAPDEGTRDGGEGDGPERFR